MRVLMLYRPESEHDRDVDRFVERYTATGTLNKIDKVNVNTREGTSTASLYDVTSYPAILVVRDDGMLQHCWQGADLPLVDDVVAYVRA